jgi:ferric-dicitrate binding protein FerR (iron transport regulator)
MIEASGYEEAARWFFRCAEPECTELELKEFEKWLEASPQHVIAFLHVEAAWRDAGALKGVAGE